MLGKKKKRENHPQLRGTKSMNEIAEKWSTDEQNQRAYGLASCPSNGFTSDSINMLARTRYLIHSGKLTIMVEDLKYKE